MKIRLILVALAVTLIIGKGLSISDEPEDSLSVGFETKTKTEQESGQIYTIPGFSAPTHTAATNTGNVDAFLFIEVSLPIIRADKVDLEAEAEEYIRSDGYIPVMQFTPQAPWLLVEEEIKDDVLHQVYCYGKLIPLKPGETTPKLFNEWSVVNCHVVNNKTGSMAWSTIASLCPKTKISVSSIQTNLSSNLTPESVWIMLK